MKNDVKLAIVVFGTVIPVSLFIISEYDIPQPLVGVLGFMAYPIWLLLTKLIPNQKDELEGVN